MLVIVMITMISSPPPFSGEESNMSESSMMTPAKTVVGGMGVMSGGVAVSGIQGGPHPHQLHAGSPGILQGVMTSSGGIILTQGGANIATGSGINNAAFINKAIAVAPKSAKKAIPINQKTKSG